MFAADGGDYAMKHRDYVMELYGIIKGLAKISNLGISVRVMETIKISNLGISVRVMETIIERRILVVLADGHECTDKLLEAIKGFIEQQGWMIIEKSTWDNYVEVIAIQVADS